MVANERVKPLCTRVKHPEVGGAHLLTACAGFKETPQSCASIFATFGHVKCQMARGPVRLTAGPPRHVPSGRSAKHREFNPFDRQVTFDWLTFDKEDSKRPEEILRSSL